MVSFQTVNGTSAVHPCHLIASTEWIIYLRAVPNAKSLSQKGTNLAFLEKYLFFGVHFQQKTEIVQIM